VIQNLSQFSKILLEEDKSQDLNNLCKYLANTDSDFLETYAKQLEIYYSEQSPILENNL
jgi:hypothetical protein